MSASMRAWVVVSAAYGLSMALAGWLGAMLGVFVDGNRVYGAYAALFVMGVWSAVVAVGVFTSAATFAVLAWISKAES